MQIAICDDEVAVSEVTKSLLQQWAIHRSISLSVHCYENGDALILAQKSECFDLIFLDVLMPLLNGIDTAKELRKQNQNVPIIFLTSSKEFAFDSYEVKALQYLLKPVSPNQLWSIMDDFIALIKNQKEIFVARTSDGFCKITLEDTNYLEAQNKSILVFPHNGTSIEIRELFSRCEEIFTLEQGFFRCHRSYIINLNFVNQFTKNSVTMTDGTTLPISRNRFLAFKESYFTYMFE